MFRWFLGHHSNFAKCPNNAYYSERVQFRVPTELTAVLSLSSSSIQNTSFSLPLIFLTLTFLKITGWVFCIMSLHLGLSDVSSDWIQIMHSEQEIAEKWIASFPLHTIKWCLIFICPIADTVIFFPSLFSLCSCLHRSRKTGLLPQGQGLGYVLVCTLSVCHAQFPLLCLLIGGNYTIAMALVL